MVNIYDILQILVPEYKINKKTNKKQRLIIKDIEKSEFTNFEPLGTFTNLFSCLLFQTNEIIKTINSGQYELIADETYNKQLEMLKKFIETHIFNPLINTKKILNLINQNIINNELMIFLSGYFNINIYIYSFESKILKIYYLDEKLDTNKKSLIIVNKKDSISPNIGFQTLKEKLTLNFNSPIIVDLHKDIYTIPIGLKENKIFEIQNNNEIQENNFIIDTIPINNLVIDDNIFDDTNSELSDDLELNNYNYLKCDINLEEINKRYYHTLNNYNIFDDTNSELSDDLELNNYNYLKCDINLEEINKRYSRENLMKEIEFVNLFYNEK
jgi:hypothetical protein